ncbi:glycoside hydrolase family 47 protein [Mucor lusitanicus]|uniref:alpha-1,2-Mannosidase n=1 Tax=Mucor circinelloides f. lusitanicus TaxID=29924 RepID=A0A8H4EWT4_MUCCL|nr:glycoside hydrolase family 47 protein [Mucor lusitanicus]
MSQQTLFSKVPPRWRATSVVFICFLIIVSTYHYKHSGDDHTTTSRRQKPISSEDTYSATSFKPKQDSGDNIRFQSQLPRIQTDFEAETEEERQTRESRREAVKASFMHAWNGYKTYAMGADELRPLTNKTNNPFGGLGATMIDSLSTMLIMDLDQEFQQVMPLVEQLNVHVNESLSVFETTIRYIGGLLSAYELSDHPERGILLRKAEELAIALLPAFDTPSGIPYYKFNPITLGYETYRTYLADAATIQLEFYTLSHHTENPIYAEKAQAITDFLESYKRSDYKYGDIPLGLFPNEINVITGKFLYSSIGFGAMGDSAYEYFLKELIFTDGQMPQFSRMYTKAIDSMKAKMLVQIPGTKMLHLPTFDTKRGKVEDTMDHLTCFVPGMLAMGSKLLNRPEDMMIAKGILDTCIYMYRSSNTNLSPDVWTIDNDEFMPYSKYTFGKTKEEVSKLGAWWNELTGPAITDQLADVPNTKNRTLDAVAKLPLGWVVSNDARYLLRPETLESLFVLYRITGDPRYQEYGWEIYQGIENYCKTPSAYASVKNVHFYNKKPALNQIDSMETFLLAETFKYLYLLFSPPNVISLDEYVLNTEAHPLKRRSFKAQFNIRH